MASEYAPTPDYDPLFIHARREAVFIFLLWLACLAWCVPYCYINGYVPVDQEVELLWGLPKWIVLGILGPWLIADVVTILFCIFIFREDDLGEAGDEEMGHEEMGHEDSPQGSK